MNNTKPYMSSPEHRAGLLGFNCPIELWRVRRINPCEPMRKWIDGYSGRMMEHVRR